MYPQISVVFIFASLFFKSQCELFIDNFETHGDLSLWKEHSDTVMMEGKSKSSFVLLNTTLYKRAILFTLLNPQMCGAALAGIKKDVILDISKYKMISLRVKGQGQYRGYEFILRHRGDAGKGVPTYVHYFQAPSAFEVVRLPIKHFKPYLMGQLVEQGQPLDRSHITSLGILAYGGAHLPKKQYGVAALEIDWIKLE